MLGHPEILGDPGRIFFAMGDLLTKSQFVGCFNPSLGGKMPREGAGMVGESSSLVSALIGAFQSSQ